MTPLTMLHYEPCWAVAVAINKDIGLVHYSIREKSFKTDDFVQFIKDTHTQLQG